MSPLQHGATSTRLKRALVLGGTALLASVATFVGVNAHAAGIPAATALTYTGYLETPDGTPIAKDIRVSLAAWSAVTAGKKVCAVETQTQTPVAGRFQITLPDECTAAVAASPDLWLEAVVDGVSLGRTKLGAVPYAVEAGHASSASSADDASGSLGTRLSALEAGFDALSKRLDGSSAAVITKYDGNSDVTISLTDWTWTGGTDPVDLAAGRYTVFSSVKLNTGTTGCTVAPASCKPYSSVKVTVCMKVADKIISVGTPVYPETGNNPGLGVEAVAFDSFEIAKTTVNVQFGMCAARGVDANSWDTRVRAVQALVLPQLD